MKRKRLKRIAAMMMAVVLTVCAATPAGSFAFASSADAQSEAVEKVVTEKNREPELYNSALRRELEAVEIATAVDIVVAAGYGFDMEHDFEGISYNEDTVKVSYYFDKGSFDGNKAGEYETYYKIVPISGKEPYLICRTISVREPETAKTADVSSDSGKTRGGEDEQGEAEVPDLLLPMFQGVVSIWYFLYAANASLHAVFCFLLSVVHFQPSVLLTVQTYHYLFFSYFLYRIFLGIS